MFTYENGILYVKKEDVPSIELNILNDVHASYRQYLEKTVYEDLEYLLDLIRDFASDPTIGLDAKVKPLVMVSHCKTQTKDSNNYYPVYGRFTKDGVPITDEWEILRIPYMDTSGKINVAGSAKVVLSVQRAAEDISYSLKSNMFNIAMPYANVRIYASNKSIKMNYRQKRYHMHDIIRAAMSKAHDYTPLHEIFTNTVLINRMDLNPYTNYDLVAENLRNTTITSSNSMGLIERLNSTQYKLGATRDALNENLTLRRAIGQTLSRPVLNYPAGTQITEAMVREFIHNRINIVHVRNYNVPSGYVIANENPIIISKLYAGMNNSDYLRKRLPEYASYMTLPHDVDLGVNCLIFSKGTELTKELIQFLIDCGYTSLQVSASKSSKVLLFSFEREIAGNYTAQLKDLLNGDTPPAGRDANEWVYYYDNPDLLPKTSEYLTCHDMIAIVSIMGEILLSGKSLLLDRDTSFLKKVLLINEIFSETLRSAIFEHVKKYRTKIVDAITSRCEVASPFWSLTQSWMSTLNREKFLAPADTVDLAAEVSQVCHINTNMPSNAEVVDEMRHLAMPFYGRICPYETPAGKKLGLVNTKAVCARYKNGLLYVPYRKVLARPNGIAISDKITWLSVKDELGKKFGDILLLKKDKNNNYLNTPILARIPNPDASDEPFIFKNIMAYELAGGYVPALPEQFLSPTANLIPFACSDDPVRISYGLSQIRQTIYLANSEKPRVLTKMYKDIMSALDSIKYISPCKGKVISADKYAVVLEDVYGNKHEVKVYNPLNAGKLDTCIDLQCKVGDDVEEGTCVAIAYSYPQPFVVRAPRDGYITKITKDAIHFSSTNSQIVNYEEDERDMISISSGRIMGQSAVFLNIHVCEGQYVHKGEILADTCMSREGFYTPSRCPLVAYGCYGYNYEDGVLATEKASVDYTSIIAHTVTTTFSKSQYKYHRATLPDGFKYKNPGQTIGTVTMREQVTAKGTEAKVHANVKATGIPFEVNAIDDTKRSKTFAYHLLGFNKLQAGDKMSGRHGNKGVVSKVLPNSEAPQLLNGLTVDFVLNPCGVPSRMNLGQIDDKHGGLIAKVLNIYINSEPFNGASQEDIAYLMQYTWDLANTPAIGDNITKQYNRAAFDEVCARYTELPKELHEDVWCNIENVIDWRGVFDPDGSAQLYDPVTDSFFDGKMTIGYPMFNKLMQEADEKINARSGLLDEQYARTTSQPQKSETSAKGQRMAEMELMALAAMGCKDFIYEILNDKSDNAGLRVNNHLKQLHISPQKYQVDPSSCYSRSVENLMYLLEGCGVKATAPKDIVDVDARTSREKYTLDMRKIIHQEFSPNGDRTVSKMERRSDLSDIED